MQWFAEGRLIALGEGHPEVEIGVKGTHEDVAGAAAHAELVPTVVPRGKEIRFELLDCAQVWHQTVFLLSVVRPDNNATVRAGREQLVGDGVPLQRVHIRVVLYYATQESVKIHACSAKKRGDQKYDLADDRQRC